MRLLFNLLAVISFLLDNGKTFMCYVITPPCSFLSSSSLRLLCLLFYGFAQSISWLIEDCKYSFGYQTILVVNGFGVLDNFAD